MGAIAESESLLRRVVPDDQGFNPEDPDAQKVLSLLNEIKKEYANHNCQKFVVCAIFDYHTIL